MHCKSYSHFFSKKFQHICVSLDVNFNESLTNDIVSFEQQDPDLHNSNAHTKFDENPLIFTQMKILTYHRHYNSEVWANSEDPDWLS